MDGSSTNPVRLEATLDVPLSRWLWLVKWLLAIPHYIALFFLFIAFMLFSLVAFFVILFTGRYPRGLFEFNVGVLRWAWRVGYYSYSVLGTDRYPPFSLREEPDYPATLDIAYPEKLTNWLVLVKWLLIIPHWLVVAVLLGTTTTVDDSTYSNPGLIGVLVLIAAIGLLFTGRYLPGVFDLVVGCHRWVLRAVAYVFLLTDVYPPFRLDQGGSEPAARPAPGAPGTDFTQAV